MLERYTEEELSKRWKVSMRTLAKWRQGKIGPAYIVVGKNRILYREEDVLAYEASRAQGELPGAWKMAMQRAAAALEAAASWKVAVDKQAVLSSISGELRKLLSGDHA